MKLNPNLKYVIENPRGMMRQDKRMQKLPYLSTTTYSSYGDKKYKPTDFWSNFPLELKPVKKVPANFTPVQDINNIEDRYRMPPKLLREIFNQMLKSYSLNE